MDSAFDEFYTKLFSLIDEYDPSAKAPKRHYPPGFDSDLIKNVKSKHVI